MVTGAVQHRSAGCARNCVFTKKEPVSARLATMMNTNHEQKVLSTTFSRNDEIFLFLKFAGGTSSIILIGAIKTFPTMKKFDIPIKSVKKEGFRQHYSLVLINGSTLAYRMTAPFTEGIVAETGFTKKKSCYNCLHF
ncbi:hypothetical protein Y032_0009g718 [Ancylostoma ceylanicum]|uniref:Uncharacterized protein n=1 Tax=Ancylostoma ceylanicum TaxID=53326 RepID=A0A016VK60_9BILA|nr:hypothetical protein Y032_0009g718 [Ancylostoma ceylanicum]